MTRPAFLIEFSLAALCLAFAPSRALADLSDDQATESVKDTFSGRTRYPFYDRAKDDVRQLNVVPPVEDDSTNRQSKWKAKTPAPKTRTPRNWGTGEWLATLLQVFGLTALIVFLGLLAWLIAKAFLKNETTESVVSKVIEKTSHDVDRVEALPFHLRKPTGDFLSEARRLYEAGNYSEAIIYLYSHLLVQLDRHHVIRLAKGKTNRQYLRECRSRPRLRAILDCTMVAFEDVFFGHHELSRERFEECWSRLDEFHGELERQERAAA